MKKILENFLELRKHMSCIILSIIGLVDIICALLILISFSFGPGILFILLMSYAVIIRLHCFVYYAPIIVILFIIERIKNIKYNNGTISTSKTYKVLWSIGFIVAIIVSLVIPFILIMYPE